MSRAKPRLPALSEAQLEIMDVVWEGGEVTVTDVWNVLAGRRQVARNTVLTLMDRLEKKGWLKRRAEGQTHLYSAVAARADQASRRSHTYHTLWQEPRQFSNRSGHERIAVALRIRSIRGRV